MPQSIATLTGESWEHELAHVDSLALPSVKCHLANTAQNDKKPFVKQLAKLLERIGRINLPARLRRQHSPSSEYLDAINELPKLKRVHRNPSPAPSNHRSLLKRRRELKSVARQDRVLLHDEFASPAWVESYELFASRRHRYLGQYCPDSGRSTPTRSKPKEYYEWSD